MLSLISYFAVFIMAVAIMVVADDDPTGVSLIEWVMFAVMAYTASQLCRRLLEIYRRDSWE